MEHPCYQCGVTVEEGIAFCPQCSAPQIRVSVAAPQTGWPSEDSVSGEIPQDSVLPRSPLPLKGISWPQALPAAALGALLAAVMMVLSLGLGLLASGFLCVLFYRRRIPASNPTAWMGARLGAVSGALAFVVFGLLTLIQSKIFHAEPAFRGIMMQAIEQTAARNPDPQVQQMLQSAKTPEGLVAVMTMGLIAMFIAFLIFSSLGGALGAAVLRRRHPR